MRSVRPNLISIISGDYQVHGGKILRQEANRGTDHDTAHSIQFLNSTDGRVIFLTDSSHEYMSRRPSRSRRRPDPTKRKKSLVLRKQPPARRYVSSLTPCNLRSRQ